jgi:hypothetical protein
MRSNDGAIMATVISTLTKGFSGLFKDNAIKRRIYPINKVPVRQFQSQQEQDE